MKFKELAVYFQRLESISKRLDMTDILAELFQKASQDKKVNIEEIVYLSQGHLLPSFKNIEFQMSEKLIHKSIVLATGKPDELIEDMFQRIGDYGEVAQKLCKIYIENLSITDVYKKLTELVGFSGAGVVVKKTEFLADLLKSISPIEVKYIIRIILGKLRLGVGDPTFLDSLSLAYSGDKNLRKHLERAYNLCCDLGLVAKILFSEGIERIKGFEVIVGCPIRMALAARMPGAKEIIEKIGTCAVEAKYDGFRCQVHKNGKEIQVYSRNLENTTHMFPEIKEGTLAQVKNKNVIYEGEAIAYDPQTGECLPFQTTVQRKRKHGIASMRKLFPLKLFVFDLLYADGDLTDKSYEQRRKILTSVIGKGDVLEVSPVHIVKTARELENIFEESLREGREGIVAKRLDGVYKAGGRNFNWIKLKSSYSGELNDTIDCVIVGYYFGKGLRASLGLGSLLACVYDKKSETFKTIAKIGSGLTEDELVKFKKMLDKIKVNSKPPKVDSLIEPDVWVEPKYVIEVQADEITRSPVHTCGKAQDKDSGYALRFPRTVDKIREDKDAQDATTVNENINLFKMQGRKT
ncbi:MAG: ATP-dependent DNA ligase [Candidatus Omnitrophica bacterium]|nr:ATP-dependent DNA ligase [Candidatus Omnitrophota bacterium]